VIIGDGRGRLDVLFRDHQDVRGRLGVDVPEGHEMVRFMDDVGRDVPGRDLAEEAFTRLILFGHSRSI
jgi:hypothetical protein